MTREELLHELEKRVGPLDEKARAAVDAALDLVSQQETPDATHMSETPTAGRQAVVFQGENPPFEEAARMSPEERQQALNELEERNRDWLQQKCQELGAGWLLVVDGQVMVHGATLDNYPTDEELLNLCQRTGKLPLLFIQDQLLAIEEATPWSPTVYSGDFYPTLSLRFRSRNTTAESMADFDTGAIEVYADWDWLSK